MSKTSSSLCFFSEAGNVSQDCTCTVSDGYIIAKRSKMSHTMSEFSINFKDSSIMMTEESHIETTNVDIDVVSYNDDNTVDQETFKKFQDKVFSKCKVNLTLLITTMTLVVIALLKSFSLWSMITIVSPIINTLLSSSDISFMYWERQVQVQRPCEVYSWTVWWGCWCKASCWRA